MKVNKNTWSGKFPPRNLKSYWLKDGEHLMYKDGAWTKCAESGNLDKYLIYISDGTRYDIKNFNNGAVLSDTSFRSFIEHPDTLLFAKNGGFQLSIDYHSGVYEYACKHKINPNCAVVVEAYDVDGVLIGFNFGTSWVVDSVYSVVSGYHMGASEIHKAKIYIITPDTLEVDRENFTWTGEIIAQYDAVGFDVP